MIRLDIRSSRSYGSRAQSAVMASSLVTARMMIGWRVGALVAHHADRCGCRRSTANACQISRSSPALRISSRTMASACCSDRDLVGRDLADDAHAEPGPGERLAPHDLVGQAELVPTRRTSSLNRLRSGSTSSKSMSSGRPPTLWWLLISRRVRRARLDDVGVERALHEERGVGQAAGVLLEDPDEQLADRLALLLGVGDAGEPLEEAVAGLDVDQLDALVAAERLDDLLALALAHQPGVDEHARELRADGPVDERGGDRRVDAARQRRRSPGSSPTWARIGVDLRLDDRRHRPRRPAPADVVEERARASPGRAACGRPRGGTARRRCRRSSCSSAADRRVGRATR